MASAAMLDLRARRRAAARPGGVRDIVVPLLKRALPLAAAALLAMLIVLPLTSSRELSFVLAKDRVAVARERLRLTGAVYRGETTDGHPFEIRSADAVQRNSEVHVVELSRMNARITLPDGPAVMTAPSGRYDMDADALDVTGPVRLVSDAGYTLNSQLVHIDMRGRTVSTDRPVSGTLPAGTFRADRMQADIRGKTVVLEGHAHLQMQPRGRKVG